MRSRWITSLFGLLLLSVEAQAQIEMSRYLDEEFRPTVDIFDYRNIYIRWEMDGKVQAFMNEGINNLADDQVNQALYNFDQATALTPNLASAHYYAGICHKLQLKFEAAEKSFQKALEYNDTLASAHIELGEMYEASRAIDKARASYEKAISVAPKLADGLLHLANLQFSQEKFYEAESLYQRAATVDPSFDMAYAMLGRLALHTKKSKSDAMHYFQRAVKADSISREGLLWRGLMYADMGEPEKALRDWTVLIQHNPNNPFYYFLRGYLQIELNDFDKAFVDFRKAISANPENTDKFVGAQTILDKRIDLQSAARVLIKRLYGFQEPEITYLKNGFCFLLAGRYQGAINWFNKVRTPAGIVFFLRAITFEHAGLHDMALTQYTKAIESDPEIVDAYKKRAIYRMELADYPAAILDITEMIRLEPQSFISYKLRGIAHALSENCDAAIEDLAQFIATDSTDRESFKTRGFCFEKNKMWALAGSDFMMAYNLGEPDLGLLTHAIDNCSKAIDLQPQDFKTRYYLGKTLFEAGDKKNGIKHLKQASQKGNLEAKSYLQRIKE